jgi:hypothetical protein
VRTQLSSRRSFPVPESGRNELGAATTRASTMARS